MESANCWGVDRRFNPSSNPSRIPSVERIKVSPLNIVCIDAVKAAKSRWVVDGLPRILFELSREND